MDQVEARRTFPIGAFDALLRDMVAFELVCREGTGPGAVWQLSAAARQRLDDLVPPTTNPAPEDLVYLDHRCHSCRRHGVTRLRDGVFLCDACRAEAAGRPTEDGVASMTDQSPPAPGVPARRLLGRRQPRAADGGPLAS